VKLLRHLFRVPVTLRSRTAGSAGLRVVGAHDVSRIEHILRVPRGACPVSRNPLGGTLTLTYSPAGAALEVVSLHGALAWACSGRAGAPRSAEELAAWAARESANALGVPVTVTLDLTLRPGRQRLCVQATAC
jgi:hypothetical protein